MNVNADLGSRSGIQEVTRRGRIAQLVEHRPYKAAVGGSSPSSPTINLRIGQAMLALVRMRRRCTIKNNEADHKGRPYIVISTKR